MKSLLKNKNKSLSHRRAKYELLKKKKKYYPKKRSPKKNRFLFFFLLFVSFIIIILFIYFLIFRKKGNQNENIDNFYYENENNIKQEIQNENHNKKERKEDEFLIKEKSSESEIEPPWFKEKLIMHSLGEYKNFDYVDSLEPLKYWYFEKKMKLMEADFMLTKDNHTILAHDFSDLNFTPTLEEFKKLKAKGNTTRMTFEDLVSFMLENKDLYIITDSKYTDIPRIEIEFEEITSILNNHKELYERFIIQVYNEKMYLFLKEKNYLFKYYLFTLYLRWSPRRGLKDLENIFDFCNKNKIIAIVLFEHLFNDNFIQLSRKYSIPLYLHTVNDIGKLVYFLQKGVKGFMTDNISDELLEKYLLDNNIKLNQTNP